MVETINDTSFEGVIENSKGLVLIDFWAEWCAPCKQLTPIIDSISLEMSETLKVYKMNIDDSANAATKLGIRSVPTLILFKDGKQVDSKVGYQPKENIVSWLNNQMAA